MAFYLAGNAARRTDPQLAELYHRLMTGAGHCHAQATIAVSRKLAERTWTGRRVRVPAGPPPEETETLLELLHRELGAYPVGA